jgi:hypothetical protein
MENILRTDCVVVAKDDGMSIQQIESLRLEQTGDKLVLDLDASAENVGSKDLMATSDKAHALVSRKFRNFIKEPILQYMREERRQ